MSAALRSVNIPFEKPAWMGEAACRGSDQDVFFPGRGASAEPAKEICRGCPVLEECYEYILTGPHQFGIWAGMSERERRRIRVQLRLERTA